MPDYAVAAKFLTRADQISPTYERMGRAADKFGRRSSSAFRNATKEGYKFGTIVKGILAANIIRGGIGQISAGLNRGATDFLKFEDTMVGAIARFDDLGPSFITNTKFVDDFSEKVRAMTVKTRFGVNDAAGALNELAKGGYVSGASLGVLANLMQFATASQEDLTEATNMSLNILNAFGLGDKDVQKQIANHVQLNDQLTKTALLSTGGLRDMFETLKMTAPLSKELGMTVDEVLALSVVLDNAGVKGTEAATALKRGWMNIFGGRMSKEFKANGITIADTNGKLLKYNDILVQIIDKFKEKNLTQEQQIPILERIFGMYGLAGNLKIFAKLRDGLGDIAELQGKIGQSQGITNTVADAQNMSNYAKLVMLGNSALEKMFQILDRFKYRGQSGAVALRDAILGWNPEKTIQYLNGTVIALGKIADVVGPLLQYLPELIKLWIGFKTVTIGLGIINLAQSLGVLSTGLATLFGTMTAGIGGFLAIAAPAFIAITAWWNALKSLFTGKDNIISEWAQDLGIVPKLLKDQNGVIIGREPGRPTGPQPWMSFGEDLVAPNSAEAGGYMFNGQLNISGAPAGSTFEQKSKGSSPITVNMLGVNP